MSTEAAAHASRCRREYGVTPTTDFRRCGFGQGVATACVEEHTAQTALSPLSKNDEYHTHEAWQVPGFVNGWVPPIPVSSFHAKHFTNNGLYDMSYITASRLEY
jgi:hypothetical protein